MTAFAGDFAIVAEGGTDQVVLKALLEAWFEDDEVVVNYEQPEHRGDGVAGDGGWNLVFQYLENGRYRDALQVNRFLVVHLDTDVAHSCGVEMPAGSDPNDVVSAVIAKLRALIEDAHQDRVIFAIAVDCIECWLLPLVFDRSQRVKRRKQTGCIQAVNHKLRQLNQAGIASAAGDKFFDRYRELASGFSTRRSVEESADNPGFAKLLDQLRLLPLPLD